MKKFLVFLALSFSLMIGVNAQKVVKTGGDFLLFGKASDTTSASATLSDEMIIERGVYGVATIAVESDEVSGTPAYSAYLQKSMNGRDWVDIDTIAHSGGGDDYGVFDPVNLEQSYYRIYVVVTSATQKSNIKGFCRVIPVYDTTL